MAEDTPPKTADDLLLTLSLNGADIMLKEELHKIDIADKNLVKRFERMVESRGSGNY